jgi:hypothetical protein
MVREASVGFSEVPPKATDQGIPIRASAPYIWQYINPDVARELLPELTEATEPQLIDYNARAIRLSDLTADDRESYRWECDRWERRRSEYCTQKKALADINTDISKTIAVRHIHLIKYHETPYD